MWQSIRIENSLLNEKWLAYNQTRLKGDRKSANKLLTNFIDDLLKETSATIEAFVYAICKSSSDSSEVQDEKEANVLDSKIVIQHPLFKRVLLPVFTKKYKEGNAVYARWIGQFEQFFYSDHKTTQQFLADINDVLREAVQVDPETNNYKPVKQRYFSAVYFLEKSYRIEPNQETLNLILSKLAQDLCYATHELPTGILLHAEVFIRQINDFKIFLEKSTDKEKWESIVKDWSLIGEHWSMYSTYHEEYRDFESYLRENKVKAWW